MGSIYTEKKSGIMASARKPENIMLSEEDWSNVFSHMWKLQQSRGKKAEVEGSDHMNMEARSVELRPRGRGGRGERTG